MLPEANLNTCYLIVDEAVARRNIQNLARYWAQHNLKVGPHTKTHKSVQVASWQIELGAVGLTTAKVGEAEIMAQRANDNLVADSGFDRRAPAVFGEPRDRFYHLQ